MQFKGYVQVKTGSCKRVKIVPFFVLNVGQTHQPSIQPVLNMQSHLRCIRDMVVCPLLMMPLEDCFYFNKLLKSFFLAILLY